MTDQGGEATVTTARRACSVCLGDQVKVLHKQSFSIPAGSGLPEHYDIVSCERCGFTYADTPATQEVYDRYYRELSHYSDPEKSSGSGFADWDVARLREVGEAVAAFIDSPADAVLEIGCANGGLLSELKRAGCLNLTGVDPSPECVRNAMLSADVPAYQGDLSEGGLAALPADERFDVIIVSHVLEHVRDLQAAMQRLICRLNPGGRLYIEVPDAARYDSHYFVPYYYFDCEHINHFSPASLRNLAAAFGLETVTIGQKSVTVANGRPYPAVYCVCRLPARAASGADGAPAANAPVFDTDARHSVSRYVELSADGSQRPEIETLAESQEEVIVWGAGSYASRLLSGSPLGRCNIIAFIDSDRAKQGSSLSGVQIQAPDYLLGCGAPVVVCSALHSVEIADGIRAMGTGNRVIVI